MQIKHNLNGLVLADWKWFHPIVITFNTLHVGLWDVSVVACLPLAQYQDINWSNADLNSN